MVAIKKLVETSGQDGSVSKSKSESKKNVCDGCRQVGHLREIVLVEQGAMLKHQACVLSVGRESIGKMDVSLRKT